MLLLSLLVAVAPLQIHLAQRALIDGYFAFWAVLCAWFLWENLQTPNHAGWLCAFGFSLFVLILTKENAAFVFAALAVTYLVFQTAGLGRGGSVTVLFVSLGAVLLALFILASMVGGLGEWISFYQMFVRKSAALPYARIHQDGPWFRYLIDFILLSPLVVVFALARLFRIDKQSRADLFWALFLGASYVVMSVIPYGQSLTFRRLLGLTAAVACTFSIARLRTAISQVQSRVRGWLGDARVCQRRSVPGPGATLSGGRFTIRFRFSYSAFRAS